MGHEIIYFDNAATSYPKPEPVYRAADQVLRHSGSPGRGGHRLSLEAARSVFSARTALAEFLNVPSERLVFTPGCTHSINYVLKSFPLKPGDVVVVSALEHNAVMRPLHQLERERGIKIAVLPYLSGSIVAKAALQETLTSAKPKLCVIAAGSNVTGETVNLEMIADLCRDHKVPLLVDAAQTAGRRIEPLSHDGISFWAASAHKGFFGSAGVGLLYVHPDFDLEPIIAGGTGSASESLEMPTQYPDRLEAGTQNAAGIAALAAGLQFIRDAGVERVNAHEQNLLKRFVDWCSMNRQIKPLAAQSFNARLPIVSFTVDGMPCDRVADLLDTEYGIAVRSGLHCAAQAHATLGTSKGGTVRASFGYFNTEDEVKALCSALASLTKRGALA
jgi:cysteine desulfurase family protein